MGWKKLGLIFQPDSRKWWMQSHASLPTPLQIEGSIYRVYFASRDADNRSHVGFFDIDLNNPKKILRVSREPVLRPGPLGCFDDHGVYAASAVRHGGNVYLYTIGWNPGCRTPLFYASIGLAISVDGGETFQKYGRAPIMARSEYDPCLVTSPVVLKEDSLWRMWYVSGYYWDESSKIPQSYYHVKYAESEDGVHWRREGVVCLDHEYPGEKNISRTWVIPADDGYCAWYSYNKGDGYKIGYAESQNGLVWKRKDDEATIHPSKSGWDSDAQAYPVTIEHQGDLFMLYNGNNFGRDGVGLAIWEAW